MIDSRKRDPFRLEKLHQLHVQSASSVSEVRELLLSFRRLNAWQDMVRLFEKYYGSGSAQKRNIPASLFNLYLNAQVKLRNDRILNRCIEQFLLSPNEYRYSTNTANIFLNHLVRSGEIAQAVKMLDGLHKVNFRLDVVSYNTLLKGARIGRTNLELVQLVEMSMKMRKIEPDPQTMNTMIAAYCDCEDRTAAYELFATAVDQGLADSITYNTMIDSHLAARDWVSAWSLLESMQKHQIPRDEATYGPFLVYLTSHDQTDKAIKLLKLIRLDNVAVSIGMFNILLHKLLLAGHHDIAATLLDTITHKGLEATERTFGMILQFYQTRTTRFLDSPMHAKLMQFLALQLSWNPNLLRLASVKVLHLGQSRWPVQQSTDTGGDRPLVSKQDLVVQPRTMDYLGREFEVLDKWTSYKKGIARHEAILRKGMLPPLQIIITALVGCIREKQMNRAKRILKNIDPAKIRHNLHYQTIMVGMISHHNLMKNVFETVKFLEVENFKLDIIFYSAIAWRLYRDGEQLEAVNWLRYAYSCGLVFDLVAWVILIECYAKLKSLAGTIWCLQTMRDNKIKLDDQARRRIKRVVKTLDSPKAHEDIMIAQALFEDLRNSGAAPVSETASKQVLSQRTASRVSYNSSTAAEAYTDTIEGEGSDNCLLASSQ